MQTNLGLSGGSIGADAVVRYQRIHVCLPNFRDLRELRGFSRP